MTADYRVNLDVYNGPLDLLLYLIRRDEVDIYDIPIARITEQYIAYVEMFRKLDPNIAGEFMVMAATLMEVKTRMLLPSAPEEEGEEEGLTLDPRAELVRQLLEYKAFKDAAVDLRESGNEQSLRHPRRPAKIEGDDEPEIDLEDIQVWDLLDAFSKMMEAIGQSLKLHEVIYDDTPVELHATDILDRLGREGAMTFQKIFEGRTVRSEIVGLFLAMLELVRQERVFAKQGKNFGEILVHLNPNPPKQRDVEYKASSEQDDAETQADAPPAPVEEEPAAGETQEEDASATAEMETPAEEEQKEPVSAPEAEEPPVVEAPPRETGTYVSEQPSPPEQDDEPGEETHGTWA
jgi:segregation and condensation protein A